MAKVSLLSKNSDRLSKWFENQDDKDFPFYNGNPVGESIANAGALELIVFYLGTGISLLGEEIFTILPFLALMFFLHKKGKVSRKMAIIWA